MSDHSLAFRSVPRTGVIYVMTEAAKLGFHYGNEAWANLGQGAPEVGPLAGGPERIHAIDFDPRTYEYSPVPGIEDLRAAVAELYNHRYRRGMASQYSAENVAIAGGGRLSLSRLAAALGRTHVGHFLPDYTAYEELLELFEMFTPIPIPLDVDAGYSLTAPGLRREIVERGLGAVIFSNPSNPTGQLTGGAKLSSWVEVARQTRSFLLIDEFYAHYVWDSSLSPSGSVSAAAFVEDVNEDPVVMLDGLTKNWRYPGWRIGWTVGPRDVIERVSSVGSFLDGGAPHPLQRAAIPLLAPDVADAEAASIRAAFLPKRELMLRRLSAMGIRVDAPPAGAFYVWGSVAGLPDGLNDGMSFFQRALEHRVITVPGVFFDINPGHRRRTVDSRFNSHLRFSFGPSRPELERGLDALEAMISAARG
ncbi:MAG: pyridoxal phosphate-dependent aminotransferase [Myxococcales bacterium]|nr:pyridoxal phosphate-dependent aminotransferase [Myxococcales bacterium]MCB9531846.1 pyridoxal phosphate-dependent aminotransferase [Myxococcales bacterium]